MSGTRRTSSRSYGTTAIASSPWIVVSVGVGVMVVLLVIALGAYRGRGPAYEAQPAPPEPTLALPDPRPSGSSPSATSSPSRRASASPSARPSRSVRPTPDPRRTSSPTAGGSSDAVLVVPPSPAPPVTGRYRVVDESHGGFIGEVQVSNTSSTAREWTARLAFPGGRLGSAWLEGAPQGTVSRTDDGFTYRSGQDLAGGASVLLRFYVERADSRPTSCTVDGGTCRGL
ncbi:Cellulose binding domain-containing protein [Micromonospora citrea]|uniref:Cellulose binding domain-containing protein n=1 Tax=Micromonospora citrea TaxID=47855 RepID=A0A1C6VUA3_9ACTN|nr:cellulose binding domain-containing protein [Micromonospora citrea]SCL69906.1 Cellulose binding domain-containing protein [Micromonospora citrea]